MKAVEREVGGFSDQAIYSDDMAYRYEFHRRWSADTSDNSTVAWVLLNPATGDTDGKRRPTLGRCIKWSQAGGFGGLTIVNLFAFRATKPRDLLLATDPVGSANDEVLERVAATAGRVVAAWGARTGGF